MFRLTFLNAYLKVRLSSPAQVLSCIPLKEPVHRTVSMTTCRFVTSHLPLRLGQSEEWSTQNGQVE